MIDDDPHRHNPDVHWRIYLGKDGEPAPICVQDFDYPDYDATRFLSPESFDSEEAAQDLIDEATARSERYSRQVHLYLIGRV